MWQWSLNKYLLVLCSLVWYSHGLLRDDPVVDTPIGQIRGLRATDGDYSMFMGIPYAYVDGSNPFGAAVPHPGFDEVFEAYDDTAICPQIEEFNLTIVGNLDCLHVNVYVPDTVSSTERLPVLVYIYGGAFSIGFAGRYLYGPKFLVEKDIILVTFNYRLGPYGFMCLNTPEIPGNQGLKDQIIALKWIKNNIEAFGGDPNKITVAGNSAGGVSADFLYKYSQEKLFDQAILQSGTTLIPSALTPPDLLAPIKLAAGLGLSTTDTNEALTYLASLEPALLISATDKLGISFAPCVEQEFDNTDRLIFDYPVNIDKPMLEHIPVMLGYNSEETLIIFLSIQPEMLASVNWFELFLAQYFNLESEELKEMIDTVTHFYIGDRRIDANVVYDIAAFSSDLSINYPAIKTLQQYIDVGSTDLYLYVFSYSGQRNFVQNRIDMYVDAAVHADELGYLFDIEYMDEPTAEDQLIIDQMTTLWANFVKYANPTPQTTPLVPTTWSAVTPDEQHFIEIGSELRTGKRNLKERMAFWKLMDKKYRKGLYGYNES